MNNLLSLKPGLYVLAQTTSGSFSTAIAQGGTMLFQIAYLVGTAMVIIGGYRAHEEQTKAALWAIIGGLIIAFAGVIMGQLFNTAGMSNAVVNFNG